MRRRLTAVLLALCIITSTALPAFASEEKDQKGEGSTAEQSLLMETSEDAGGFQTVEEASTLETGEQSLSEGAEDPASVAETGEQSSLAETGKESAAKTEEQSSLAETGKESAAENAEELPVQEKIKPYGSPWINSNVYGMITEDTPRPGVRDDFYLAVNYDYLNKTKIKPGHEVIGTEDEISDLLIDRISGLMTDSEDTSPEADRVRTLYQMYLDWEGREKGRDYISSKIKTILNISSLEDLSAYLGSWEGRTGTNILEIYLDTDIDDPGRHMTDIGPTSLTLGTRDEYESITDSGKRKKKHSDSAAKYMLIQYAGCSEEAAQELIENRYAFEKAVSESMMNSTELAAGDSIRKRTNIMTAEELAAAAPALPIKEMLSAVGFDPSLRINLEQPAWLTKLNELYTEENLEQIRAYLVCETAAGYIGKADEAAYREAKRLEREFSGLSASREDEYYATNMVARVLWQDVDKMYVAKYCSPQMKEDIRTLMEEAISTYREMLTEETWLSPETREKAISKLDHLTLLPVYPDDDKWLDWSQISITPAAEGGNYALAMDEISEAQWKICQQMSFEPIDKQVWNMRTSEMNAAYMPTTNSILVFAGMLNGKYYNESMSREEKMGAIGTVIGHEISHAFDPTGSQFDETGAVHSWWTDDDRAAFDKRASKLIAAYDDIHPWKDGSACNGTILQGEVAADMGGMACMLRIAKTIDGFDYDKFFRAYAELDAVGYLENVMENIYKYDPHPPYYLRVNMTLPQFDEFQRLYDIQPGDGMYVAPADRIAIWGMGRSGE